MVSQRTPALVSLQLSPDDVRRLVCACPAYRAAVRAGLDPDDLRQDVLVAVYSRRWDPTRGSASTYVWLVTRSVVDAQRRRARFRQAEQLDDQADGQAAEPDHLPHGAQIERAARELGLTDDELELLARVVDGQIRLDSRRVRALAARVLERLGAG